MYTAKVPARSQREVTIPHITKGMSDAGESHDAASGYAKMLKNCSYKGQQLQLGRGGLKQILNGTTYFSTTGVFNKFIYDDLNEVYYAISEKKGLFKIDGGVPTLLYAYDNSSTSTGKGDVAILNGDVVFLIADEVYRCDGTDTFKCGNIYTSLSVAGNTGNNFEIRPIPVSYAKLNSSLDIYSETTNVNYGVRFDNLICYMKKVGNVSGTVTATVTVDPSGTPTTYDSIAVNIDIGILPGDADIIFSWEAQIEIPKNTDWEISLLASDGDTDNYVAIASTAATPTSDFMYAINGYWPRKGTGLLVYLSRLYLYNEGKTAYGNEIQYCNYNNADDWFSSSSDGGVEYGGWFYLDDNINGRVRALAEFKSNLVVSGYSGGIAITELRDENHDIINTTAGAVQANQNLIRTKDALFFIYPRTNTTQFAMYAWNGTELDLSMTPDLGAVIQKTVGAQWTSGDLLIAAYDESSDTVWVAHGAESEFFVYYIKTGQWVKFSFDVTVESLTYSTGSIILATSTGYVYEYQGGTIASTESTIDYEIETKKLRFSRFHRTGIKQFLWDIEDADFAGTVTVQSEQGNADVTAAITGDPPISTTVRAEDTGLSFKLDSVTITDFTAVGEIACMLTTDGRSNT